MKRVRLTAAEVEVVLTALRECAETFGDDGPFNWPIMQAAYEVLEKPPTLPNIAGIPEHFHPVVLEHGRELFNIVYSSGLGQHGMGLLAQHAPAGSPAHRHLTVVTGILNTLIETAISLGGWTQEEVAACRTALERVVDSRIVVPRPEGRIILDS